MKRFSQKLLNWFDRHQRDLPWRANATTGRTPPAYHVLVSELMLQQTQVATVIPYFHRFIARFPTLQALADADEQEVLRLWQGLGYYARARNLQKAARQVVSTLDGELPRDVDALLELPGIGRYTAGAISSIAFNRPAPILDGNVMRVLCRLDDIRTDPREPATLARLWSRAEELLPEHRGGDFNAALMELGALICVPRSPRCLLCPVQNHCAALAAGTAEQIPLMRKKPPTPRVRRRTFCIRRGQEWLIEQRPATGRWSSLWQFVTRGENSGVTDLPVVVSEPKFIGEVSHALTHRRYTFEVLTCNFAGAIKEPGTVNQEWTALSDLGRFPLPRPQLKIAEMLRNLRP